MSFELGGAIVLFTVENILNTVFDNNPEKIVSNKTDSLLDDYFRKHITNIKDAKEQDNHYDEICNLTRAYMEDGFKAGFKTAIDLYISSLK